MSCDRPLERIHAALDGELQVADALEMEGHVRSCPACAAEYRRALALRAALRDRRLRAVPRAGFEDRLKATLRRSRPGTGRPVLRDALALAATLVVGVALGRFLLPGAGRPPGAADAFVDGHVRALAAGPLTQVASSDHHTVKPWFAGKLDFSPSVPELSAEGFPLEGGRVDRVAGRPAAVLVYRRGNHVIGLFETVSAGGRAAGVSLSGLRGYHVARWSAGDLDFAAVSDMDGKELLAFADLARR